MPPLPGICAGFPMCVFISPHSPLQGEDSLPKFYTKIALFRSSKGNKDFFKRYLLLKSDIN